MLDKITKKVVKIKLDKQPFMSPTWGPIWGVAKE